MNFGDADLAPWAYWNPTSPDDYQSTATTLKDITPALESLGAQLVSFQKRIDLPALLEKLKIPLLDVETPTPSTSPLMQSWASFAPESRVMIALYPALEVQARLAVPGGEAAGELHCTLLYLGTVSEVGDQFLDEGRALLRSFASRYAPLEGVIGGYGRFSASESSDGKDVIYASVDVPELAHLREMLALEVAELIPLKKDHGFTPHITLAYLDPYDESPVERLEPIDVLFTALELVVGGQRQSFPLKGQQIFRSLRARFGGVH
jgi:2'-5' RNA ligase